MYKRQFWSVLIWSCLALSRVRVLRHLSHLLRKGELQLAHSAHDTWHARAAEAMRSEKTTDALSANSAGTQALSDQLKTDCIVGWYKMMVADENVVAVKSSGYTRPKLKPPQHGRAMCYT